MVERITQRANFGNLRPQARQVDIFRRPDSRDHDAETDLVNQRLEAFGNFVKGGFDAYASYRESKQEEVALKAKADAVKNANNPNYKGDPEYENWKVYDSELKRTQNILTAQKEGNELLKDDQFIPNIFEDTERANQSIGKDDWSNQRVSTIELTIDKETGKYNAEEVYQKSLDRKVKAIIEKNPDIDVVELKRFTDTLEQEFFKEYRKRDLQGKIATYREVVSATTFDSEEVQKNIFAITGDPNQFNDKFYEHIGNLSDKGMAIGLTRDVAVAEALKVVIQDAYMYDNQESQGGRNITEEENNRIINLLGALSANVKDTRVLRKGGKLIDDGDVQKGTGYAGFVLKAITDLDKILENAETETDNNAKKQATAEKNQATMELSLDIINPNREKEVIENGKKIKKRTGIQTPEELQRRFKAIGEMEFNNYLLFPYWEMSQRFERTESQGGVENKEGFDRALMDIHTGKLRPITVTGSNANYIKNTYGVNSDQQTKLLIKVLGADGSGESMKLYTARWDKVIAERLVGNYGLYKNILQQDGRLQKIVSGRFAKWAERAGAYEKDNRNAPIEEKNIFYEKLIKELDNDFDAIEKTYFEEDPSKAVIDIENLDTLPDFITVKNDKGVPEFLYMSYLFEEDPEAWQDIFGKGGASGLDLEEKPKFFSKAKQRAKKIVQNDPSRKLADVIKEEIKKDRIAVQQEIMSEEEIARNHPNSYENWKQKTFIKNNQGFENTFLNYADKIFTIITGKEMNFDVLQNLKNYSQ